MRKIIPLLFSILALAISGCNKQSEVPASEKHEHTFNSLVVMHDADWRTYLVDSDFNTQGLKIGARCSTCNKAEQVDYIVENNTKLVIDQKFVTIKYQDLSH